MTLSGSGSSVNHSTGGGFNERNIHYVDIESRTELYILWCCCFVQQIPDDHVCLDFGQGMMCIGCSTDYARLQRDGARDPSIRWIGQLDRRCTCCGSKTVTNINTFLFPHGCVMCKKCADKYMRRRIEDELARGGMQTHEEAQAFMRKVYVDRKSRKRARDVRRGAPKMKANRMRNRQKRA